MGSVEEEDLRELLERAEPNDTLARWQILREVERGLFGAPDELRRVGRYRLIARIGGGGQGTVYVAHDPELDRDVAIKVVRSDQRSPEAQQRLLREAAALAQLSHPNVVAVNDVGECEAGVFIVTQLVPGVTLARWLAQPRSWREVVQTFVAAGGGLVAAHASGIVHRDFKPANVVLAEDGAVRLLDFGLARAADDGERSTPHEARRSDRWSSLGTSTNEGQILGTPVYMAPEQHAGRAATPAADQYAFCVALYEGLARRRPFRADGMAELAAAKLSGWPPSWPETPGVPRVVQRLVVRGLAPDPADRWPSMATLVAGLEASLRPDRARRVAIVSVLATGIAASLGIAMLDGAETRVACADAEELATIWSDARRAAIEASFMATQREFAADATTRTLARIDAYAQDWRTARVDACAALQHDPTADLRMACLDRQRAALEASLRVLESADAEVVSHADDVLAELAPPESCEQAPHSTRGHADSPAAAEVHVAIAHARALDAAGRHADAAAELDGVVARAQELGDPVLATAADLAHGTALRSIRELDRAQSALERAYLAAEAERIDDVAFAAALELAELHGFDREDASEGRNWLRRSEAVLARRGTETDPIAEGELALARADVAERAGEYPTAIAEGRRAVERLEGELGGGDPRVARALRSLARALVRTGEIEAADSAARRSLELTETALGPDHPETAAALRVVGRVLRHRGDLDASLEIQRRVRAAFERAFGAGSPEVATTLENIAVLHSEMGHPHEAEAAYREVLAIHRRTLPKDDPAIARTLHNYAITLRDLERMEEASGAWREAIAIAQRTLGPEHIETAIFSTMYGGHLAGLGRVDEGLAMLEQTVAVLRRTAGEQHPRTMMAWTLLGNVQGQVKDLRAARHSIERAMAIAEAVYGPEHVEMGRLLHTVANLHAAEGDAKQAVAVHERAIAVVEATLGPNHTAIADMLTDLAASQETLGQHRAAARSRARSAAILRAVGIAVPTDPPD